MCSNMETRGLSVHFTSSYVVVGQNLPRLHAKIEPAASLIESRQSSRTGGSIAEIESKSLLSRFSDCCLVFSVVIGCKRTFTFPSVALHRSALVV